VVVLVNIAMVEDDIELAIILTQYLSKFNIKVTNYEDPFVAISAIELGSFDLVILDLTLPGIDGLEVCKELRSNIKNSNIPIIVSSARSDITDKVTALELGADDYLPKPYDPRELEVRIKTVLRRYNKDMQSSTNSLNIQEIFNLNEEKKEITKQGIAIHFTTAEFQIFALMCQRKGFVVSRYDILEYCDYLNSDENSGSIAVIINRIRAKIEENPKSPKYLITIRGMGYKLVE
jgi:two-component system OmpR family response regulator